MPCCDSTDSVAIESPIDASSSAPALGLRRWGTNYVDEGAEAYENRSASSQSGTSTGKARLRRLTSVARELGYQLTPLTARV